MQINEAQKLFEGFCKPGICLGLERVRALMRALGNPQKRCKYVHIAGTNGKGSTCAMTEYALRKSGYKTGMYVSPALSVFNERIRINGKYIDDKFIEKYLPMVISASRKIQSEGFEAPSVFEAVTALAFLIFAENKCDIVVLEVGMGGRLDATNVITSPEVCAITSIALDHTEYLGDTREKVAGEKAEIIKKGADAVIYDNGESINKIFCEKCKQVGAFCHICDFNEISDISLNRDGSRFNYKGNSYRLSLLGKYQIFNAVIAVEILNCLKKRGFNIESDSIISSLNEVAWQGRLTKLNSAPLVLLDGAHNPDGARALAESLASILGNEKAYMLCGMLADKDVKSSLSYMLPYCKKMFCTTPPVYRAMSDNELSSMAKEIGFDAVCGGEPCSALRIAYSKAKEDNTPLVIFGSLYMSGQISARFEKIKNEEK